MSQYQTNHPAVLEALLRWQDLSQEEQETLLTGLRTNDLKPVAEGYDPVMPMFLTIRFPLNRLDPRHPAEALGQVQMLIEPRASRSDATPHSV